MNRLLLALAVVAGVASVEAGASEVPELSVAVAPVNFGVYDPSDPRGLSSTGFVEVRSGGATAYRVLLSSGGAGSYRSRRLLGERQLHYNLFADPALRQVWGDGSEGTVSRAESPSLGSAPGRFTIYGFLPPGQRVPSGVYSDTIVVTIEF